MSTLDRVMASLKVDKDRLQGRMPIEVPDVNRDDLASLFHELKFTKGAEIGVEQGAYAEVLCRKNPGLTLSCVDAWQVYPGYRDHVTQEKLDLFFESTKARLEAYACEFVRKFSVHASRQFADHELDFVYIDANHTLEHVIADMAAWIPKVRPGGIISGHDYSKRSRSNRYQCHVVEAVQAWTQAYAVTPWFVLGSKDVVAGARRDRPRSWLWVK